MKSVPETHYNNSHVWILREEEAKASTSVSCMCCKFVLYLLAILALLFICWLLIVTVYLEDVSDKASMPKFFIETITSSNIDISSSSQISAQNLTINFVVENHAPHPAVYNNAIVSILYKRNVIWSNMLGLYWQQKGERTSVQVPFGNFPVEMMNAKVANAINKENRENGYGIFTVDITGCFDMGNEYGPMTLQVYCGDVKLQFSSPTHETGLPRKCTVELWITDKLYFGIS